MLHSDFYDPYFSTGNSKRLAVQSLQKEKVPDAGKQTGTIKNYLHYHYRWCKEEKSSMQNVNYGIEADCDTSADIIALLTADKNPVEICGIINKLLTMLYSSGVKVIDGDNPKDDFLDRITYDRDTDNLYFWTENI